MRAAEFGAIALGIVAVWSSACSKSSNTAQGSKAPSASNAAPAQQQPAVGGGPTEPGAANATTTPKDAVASMAEAQCDREVRCKKVGQNQTYKTREDCVSKLEHTKGQSINDKVCTGGINQGNLNACITALKVEECSNPVSSIQRAGACKTADLCVKKK